jgi:broad specificity phosphatase PhoE
MPAYSRPHATTLGGHVSTTPLSAGRASAPAELVLVRHGESVGNLADAEAREKGLGRLRLDTRDADTPLSENGVRQAEAVGRHLATLPEHERPEVVLGSPYVRAAATAEHALRALGGAVRLVRDERLRERDLGAFDGMTGQGIREAFPEEAERRATMGKFYYRPPGGESWTDVALRVRSVLTDLRHEHDGRRVWVFSHQAVIMSFRYLIEELSEQDLLRIDGETPMGNCAITRYQRGGDGALRLLSYADLAHLERSEGAEPTHEEPARPSEPTHTEPSEGEPAEEVGRRG